MNEKTIIRRGFLTGERALFQGHDLSIADTTFADGESPLKESRNIELTGCLFRWKYPLWYSHSVALSDCTLFETARAGIWYTDDLAMKNCLVEAPKTFRRCHDLRLHHVFLPNAAETLWNCDGVTGEQVTARGDYFAMNSRNIALNDFELTGNYSFDGAENVEIHGARMLSRDAFWNSDHVTVYDSFISGEYLGWNSRNLTLVNCTIESLQGMCYIGNLTMKNCKLLNTTLAFEYSTVDADIDGAVDSVLNPAGGTIHAESIGELILEPDKIDPAKTTIFCHGAK